MEAFQRRLSIVLPERQSAFLWGARKTGKSTFLRQAFPGSLSFDFLRTDLLIAFTTRPALLREQLLARSPAELALPVILDEVHGPRKRCQPPNLGMIGNHRSVDCPDLVAGTFFLLLAGRERQEYEVKECRDRRVTQTRRRLDTRTALFRSISSESGPLYLFSRRRHSSECRYGLRASLRLFLFSSPLGPRSRPVRSVYGSPYSCW